MLKTFAYALLFVDSSDSTPDYHAAFKLQARPLPFPAGCLCEPGELRSRHNCHKAACVGSQEKAAAEMIGLYQFPVEGNRYFVEGVVNEVAAELPGSRHHK